MRHSLKDAKAMLLAQNPALFDSLRELTREAQTLSDLLTLSNVRKRAVSQKICDRPADRKKVRLALVGGYSFHPLAEAIQQLFFGEGDDVEIFLGEFDSAESEAFASRTRLEEFRPDYICIFPARKYLAYPGSLADSLAQVVAHAQTRAAEMIGLGERFHSKTGAQVILSNLILPGHPNSRSVVASEWNFRRRVNTELSTYAPAYLQICDLEFLGGRIGNARAEDPRTWYESRQLGSAELLFEVAKEIVWQARAEPAKKVLVLDADDTLWGGVVAEEGLSGIELGDTSPRGEAFKDFQRYILSLKAQGVLLALCSKNDSSTVLEVLDTHPEMVLRRTDFVRIVANWQPKSENLKQIALDLNVGLDSLVFVDDSPAEIELVRQETPQVLALLLGSDPSEHIGLLHDTRAFEKKSITPEDLTRTALYQSENKRSEELASSADLSAYLESLQMVATFSRFRAQDVPRIAQLINKSNQFNLTTHRRTEAQVYSLINANDKVCFSVRLEDKFGDYGLIGVVILDIDGTSLSIDTWCMSCRVLQRQVEQQTLNYIVECARERECTTVVGVYLPTQKNGLVSDLYPNLGFTPDPNASGIYRLSTKSFSSLPTFLSVRSHLDDTSRGPKSSADNFR